MRLLDLSRSGGQLTVVHDRLTLSPPHRDAATSIVSISVSGYSIAVSDIEQELDCSHELALAGIALFTLTFGMAPLVGECVTELRRYGGSLCSCTAAMVLRTRLMRYAHSITTGAPLSEVWGRRWIYIVSAVLYTIFQIPQAVCTNIQTMLVSRFIAGIGGSR